MLGKREGYKKAILPSFLCVFHPEDYEIGKQLSSQISGTARTTNHNEEKKPDSHKLPPHSLIFTNKAKEQNISIFFLFFCPKSISIFNTTAFCNRWTITHVESKPGNIKTFSTFVVWCHFWRQCLGEMHFFTFTPHLSLRGHLDSTMLWQTGKVTAGRWGRWTVKTLPSSTHFQSYSILRGFCPPWQAWLWYKEQVADLLIILTGTLQHLGHLLSIQLFWVCIHMHTFKTSRF